MAKRFFTVILLVLVLGILGFGGYRLWHTIRPEAENQPQTAGEQATELVSQGNPDLAQQTLEAALEDRPDDKELAVRLARLTSTTNPERARQLVEETVNNPEASETLLLEATPLALQLQMFEEAGRMITRLLEINPNNPQTLKLVGIFSLISSDLQQARAALERADQLNPGDDQTQLILGQVLARSDNLIDKTRGKVMLSDVGLGGTGEYQLSALLFLALSTDLPISQSEFETIYDALWSHPQFDTPFVNSNISILRTLALRFRAFNQDRAFAISKRIVNHADHSMADEVAHAFLGQVMGQPAEVRSVVDRLEQKARDEAATMSEEMLARVNAVVAHQLLVEKQTDAGIAKLQEEASRRPNSPFVLQILFAAVRDPDYQLSIDQKDNLVKLLVDHPLADPQIKLGGMSQRLELKPLQREQIIAEAIERFRESAPVELGRWLILNRQAAPVLELFPEEKALQDPTALELRFSALALVERFDEMEALMEKADQLLQPMLRETMRTLLAGWQQDTEAVATHWDRAFALARDAENGPALLRMARMAMEYELADRAREAYTAARAEDVGFQELDLTTYMTLALSNRDTRTATVLAAELADRFPDNPVYVNNSSYLDLLSGERLEKARDRMVRLVDQYPNESNYRMTLALGHLRNGEADKALRIVESTNIDLNNPSSQAIYAAVLAATNRRPLAQSIAANIDRTKLLDAEWALVDSLQGGSIPN